MYGMYLVHYLLDQSLYNAPSLYLIKYYVFIPFCNAEFKVLDLLKQGSSSCAPHKISL